MRYSGAAPDGSGGERGDDVEVVGCRDWLAVDKKGDGDEVVHCRRECQFSHDGWALVNGNGTLLENAALVRMRDISIYL